MLFSKPFSLYKWLVCAVENRFWDLNLIQSLIFIGFLGSLKSCEEEKVERMLVQSKILREVLLYMLRAAEQWWH